MVEPFGFLKEKGVSFGQCSWLVGFSAQIVKCKTSHEYECILLYVQQIMKWVETFFNNSNYCFGTSKSILLFYA